MTVWFAPTTMLGAVTVKDVGGVVLPSAPAKVMLVPAVGVKPKAPSTVLLKAILPFVAVTVGGVAVRTKGSLKVIVPLVLEIVGVAAMALILPFKVRFPLLVDKVELPSAIG